MKTSGKFNPILGFGLGGYRSFGDSPSCIGPCGKVNLLIGQNNSGKSNILRFLQDHYKSFPTIVRGGEWQTTGLEQFRSAEIVQRSVSFGIQLREEHRASIDRKYSPMRRQISSDLDALIAPLEKCSESGFWLHYTFPKHAGGHGQVASELIRRLEEHPGYAGLCHDMAHAVGIGAAPVTKDNIPKMLRWLCDELVPTHTRTPISLIPSLRQPGRSETSSLRHSGDDIIHQIAQLQNPDHENQDLKNAFARIVEFFREVTDHPTAEIEVPYKRETIIVHMDGRSLPLEALGTGIHEVLILAATATVLRNHVICIEEPELHLHPLLQKKLLRYLEEKTENQYFITTHSAHLLDHPGASIFHVQLTDTGSVVTSAAGTTARFAICTDLGYRASDLLQTNCILWVEGPSDRLYLRAWIQKYDSNLAEGIDYTIMFYGGRLLAHLSPTDSEIEDFINLRKLNRNMVILMDSDRENLGEPINATKKRIVDSWAGEPGFAWVTAGREAENYVEPAAMLEALQAIAPNKNHKQAGQHDRCVGRDANGNALADKVKLAHWLAENDKLSLAVLDLESKIKATCEFIRASNLISTAANK